jgi:toxin ParE1/3/4
MKPVRFHAEAEQELLEHEGWYRKRSDVAAQGFLLDLERAIAAVGEAPERWPIGRRGEHRYIFPHYPFTLLYRIREDQVFVTAVAHQSRRPGYWHHRT